MVAPIVGSTKFMTSIIKESTKNGGGLIFVDGKSDVGNFTFNNWHMLGEKYVSKIGKSFFRDGNKLGKRKTELVKPFIENISQ